MSLESDKKREQNYSCRRPSMICGNCVYLRYELELVNERVPGVYSPKKVSRCGIGGFVVNKRGICDRYELGGKTQP